MQQWSYTCGQCVDVCSFMEFALKFLFEICVAKQRPILVNLHFSQWKQGWTKMEPFIIAYFDKVYLSKSWWLPQRNHHSWKELILRLDACHWKEREVTWDATLAGKLYAKSTGYITQEAAALLHPVYHCIRAAHRITVQHSIENQSKLQAGVWPRVSDIPQCMPHK